MLIYILGGEGFIGSAFVRYCKNNSINFISINKKNYKDFIGSRCDILINANGNSKKYLAQQDEMFDFDASTRSVKRSLVDFIFNKYVYLSASDVYSNTGLLSKTHEKFKIDVKKISNYGFHKYLAELCVIHGAKNWLIFRLGGFVGANLKKNPVFDIVNNKNLQVHENSKFQFMETDKTAEIVFKMIKKNLLNEIFNLVGNGNIKVKEIYEIANKQPLKNHEIKDRFNYNVSNKKIRKFISIPNTKSVIKNFIINNSKKID